jgi:ceramide glucosyltransferase
LGWLSNEGGAFLARQNGRKSVAEGQENSEGLRLSWIEFVVLGFAATPFIYYSIVLYSTLRFFSPARFGADPPDDFTPPVSNLKPVCGVDPEAYENFASYCRQDYPDYELLFCAGDKEDPAVPVIEKLKQDFPSSKIRLVFCPPNNAVNDKVAKLARLVEAARHETLVINDADVRVRPNYLRKVVAPLQDASVGAVTCMYTTTHEYSFAEKLQSIGMVCDFYPGILVAWQLDGVKFALGQTMVTSKSRIAGFGGYGTIENLPADDLLLGRKVDAQGYKVVLLPYTVETVADFSSARGLLDKRLRWMTVMRHMRPWGHLGLIFTQGLPWCVLAALVSPSVAIALVYFGGYAAFRLAITLWIGILGVKQPRLVRKLPLIPVWDATAFLIWLASFANSSIRWRGVDYRLAEGRLVPAGRPNTASRLSGETPLARLSRYRK